MLWLDKGHIPFDITLLRQRAYLLGCLRREEKMVNKLIQRKTELNIKDPEEREAVLEIIQAS